MLLVQRHHYTFKWEGEKKQGTDVEGYQGTISLSLKFSTSHDVLRWNHNIIIITTFERASPFFPRRAFLRTPIDTNHRKKGLQTHLLIPPSTQTHLQQDVYINVSRKFLPFCFVFELLSRLVLLTFRFETATGLNTYCHQWQSKKRKPLVTYLHEHFGEVVQKQSTFTGITHMRRDHRNTTIQKLFFQST